MEDDKEVHKSLSLLLIEARRIQDELIQSKEVLEKKAAEASKSMLTIIGLFVTINSFIFVFSTELENKSVIGFFGLISIFLFIVSLGLTEYSNHIRKYSHRSLDKLLKLQKNFDFSYKQKAQHLLTAYNEGQKSIHDMNNEKACWLKWSKRILIVGLFSGLIFTVILICSMI